MPQMDLYSLLRGFADKTKSPYINVGEFVGFIEKYALRNASNDPEWSQWANNARSLFNEEIPELVENGQCMLLADGKDGRLFIPASCGEHILNAYNDIDKMASMPFPTLETLALELPEGYAKVVNLSFDMGLFFEENDEAPEQDEVIALQFPQNYGSALLLASMIPTKLMEISLLKIRNYLGARNNKDYVLNKLTTQMQGRDKIIRDIIERIMVRPLDCLSEMERSADFPYLFWTYFCPLVKNDITKKNDFLSDDLAALQAACVIEVCCSFYRTQAAKKREKDAAFLTLELIMDRHPWRYSLDDIVEFTNDRRVPLLDIYSLKDLEEYIQKAIVSAAEASLPSWLVVQGSKKGERWFIKKERYLNICTRMLMDIQPTIKSSIIERWTTMIREYNKEPTMESDAEFEKLLQSLTKTINPNLQTMLEDTKLYLVYLELERMPGAIPQPSRIFKDGTLLPYSALFALHRKELLSDIKFKLPFWYSIPFVVAIIKFFRKFGFKKKENIPMENDDDFVIVEQESNELRQSARMIMTVLVPAGKTIDGCLSELEGKWVRLLDKKARNNLVLDVQSLLRDNLRNALRVYKLKRITREGLQEMSSLLINRNPALKSLTEQEALRLYMEMYMIKILLENNKDH